ncbi:MAG TPA: glycosyltransferase family 1 protein [Anaerolineales bacterium]|nr:glycosyltransferase family 1 protein [Anaerolineales bacterium]
MNSRPRIGISARGLGKVASGPNSYIEDFTRELIHQAQDYEIHVYYNSSDSLGFFADTPEHVVPASNIFFWDHILLPRQMKRDGISLAIFPKGTISISPPCQAIPIMLDLGYFYGELNPYKRLNTIYMKPAMRYAAKKAVSILTISEHTRQDVIRLLDVRPEKVLNIYGAASESYRPIQDPVVLNDVRRRYSLKEPFIFFPTSISPRKNFPRLLDAFESVQDKIPHHLYFTGSVSWNADAVLERLKGPISERVHQLGKVPFEDMADLYTLAQFTVYPSLFEGLGLPVLEAFQCGSAVITSGETSLPEVAGDAALIVDAYSIESIAQGLVRLGTDAGLRSELRRKGFDQARLFTWERTVSKVLDHITTRIFFS